MDVTPQSLPFRLAQPGADRLIRLLARRFAQCGDTLNRWNSSGVWCCRIALGLLRMSGNPGRVSLLPSGRWRRLKKNS